MSLTPFKRFVSDQLSQEELDGLLLSLIPKKIEFSLADDVRSGKINHNININLTSWPERYQALAQEVETRITESSAEVASVLGDACMVQSGEWVLLNQNTCNNINRMLREIEYERTRNHQPTIREILEHALGLKEFKPTNKGIYHA